MKIRQSILATATVVATGIGMLLTASPAQAVSADTQACRDASNSGGLRIGASRQNSGAPNFVPDGCTSIWMKLTEVHYITYAKACLETSSGRNYRCGPWVYLEDGGAWNRLLPKVSGGNQWQLYLKAEGPGYVGFDFSG